MVLVLCIQYQYQYQSWIYIAHKRKPLIHSHPGVVHPFFGFAHRREERTVLWVDAVDAVPVWYLLVIWQEVLST